MTHADPSDQAPAPEPEHPPATETRFALVLNGGVSLAVWMGGVTHELNRLRLASVGEDAAPTDAAELRVHRAWAAVLEAVSRRATVDVVAGTSAGGLNGTLLATAVARGRDLPDMRTTWSNVASLTTETLLRHDAPGRQSLLSGDFFHERIQALLSDVDRGQPVAEPAECTLLVTSTAIDAPPEPISLEGGARATMSDSRRVFRFRRACDAEGNILRDDFATDADALALASRASASFPVAFEPVLESDRLHDFRHPADAGTDRNWLIDGGVLDNAPFGPLIDELADRPISAPFERVVVYVTPSPGMGASTPLDTPPRATAVLGRVVGAAREPDQRLDYQGLRDAFSAMGFTRASPHHALVQLLTGTTSTSLPPHPETAVDHPDPALPGSPAEDADMVRTPEDVVQAAVTWLPAYRRSRAEAVERYVDGLQRTPRFAPPPAPTLEPEGLWSVPPGPSLRVPGQWHWGLATAERVLRWWGRALVECASSAPGADLQGAFTALDTGQRHVAQLRRELQELMDDVSGLGTGARVALLNAYYAERPPNGGPCRDTRILQSVTATAQAIADDLGTTTATELLDYTLALEVMSAVLAWETSSEGDQLRFRYRQVTPGAAPLVDVGEAAKHPAWLERKLYGERWGHFGAFASQAGRNADWLWGRLDGASALCDYLLTTQDGAPLDAATGARLRAELAAAILEAEGSNPSKLRAAADKALETEPMDLVLDMPRGERREGIAVLWRNLVRLLDRPAPPTGGGLPALHALRAAMDPAWTVDQLPPRAGLGTQLKARAIRAYAAPARKILTRMVNQKLDI